MVLGEYNLGHNCASDHLAMRLIHASDCNFHGQPKKSCFLYFKGMNAIIRSEEERCTRCTQLADELEKMSNQLKKKQEETTKGLTDHRNKYQKVIIDASKDKENSRKALEAARKDAEKKVSKAKYSEEKKGQATDVVRAKGGELEMAVQQWNRKFEEVAAGASRKHGDVIKHFSRHNPYHQNLLFPFLGLQSIEEKRYEETQNTMCKYNVQWMEMSKFLKRASTDAKEDLIKCDASKDIKEFINQQIGKKKRSLSDSSEMTVLKTPMLPRSRLSAPHVPPRQLNTTADDDNNDVYLSVEENKEPTSPLSDLEENTDDEEEYVDVRNLPGNPQPVEMAYDAEEGYYEEVETQVKTGEPAVAETASNGAATDGETPSPSYSTPATTSGELLSSHLGFTHT